MFFVVLLVPGMAHAQSEAGAQPPAQSQPGAQPEGPPTGGSEFGTDPAAPPRVIVPGDLAVLMEDGFAAAPANAPVEVQSAIFAANEIVGKPYKYGGGHAKVKDSGYDCSGTVSYALNGGGLLKRPLDSGSFMRWGAAGEGDWVTVYTNPGHAYVVIAGLRLDTSSAGDRESRGRGPRWRGTGRAMRGFKRRHPVGF
jgi:cell wall-associated NlpC family hydrolase